MGLVARRRNISRIYLNLELCLWGGEVKRKIVGEDKQRLGIMLVLWLDVKSLFRYRRDLKGREVSQTQSMSV